jgi:hypothetical protein
VLVQPFEQRVDVERFLVLWGCRRICSKMTVQAAAAGGPGVATDLPQHLHAVHAGHHDVEQDQTGDMALNGVEGLLSAGDAHCLVASDRQQFRQRLAGIDVVIDHQNVVH